MFLAFVSLILGLSSRPAQSQLNLININEQAPILVDGRVVFEVHGTNNLSAFARARSINAVLARELQEDYGNRAVTIEVVEDAAGVYLQSQRSQATLVTITEADILTSGLQPYSQAEEWAQKLEDALRTGQQERKPAYRRQALLYSLVVGAIAIAIHFTLQVVKRRGSHRLDQWFEHTANPVSAWEKPIKLFWKLALLGLNIGLWLTVVLYVTDLFPHVRSWRYALSTILTAKTIDLASGQYSALELLLLVGMTVGLWFAARAIAQLFRRHILSRARLDTRIQDIFSVLAQYVVIFLGLLLLLQIWGIDISSLTILASVLGVGIGFGVQNITNNFISGFIITLERPIQIGDFIKVGELVGSVKRIGARSTEIYTLDQVTIIVPNSRFLESEVINWSHGNPVSRMHVPVSVAYESDITLVKQALLAAIKRHPEVLLRPEPEVWFQGFGDNALNFEIMVWTGEPRKQFRVKSDLNYEIEASLRRHGIHIPFPQRDLHLRSPQLDELVGLLKHQVIRTSDDHSQNGPAKRPPLSTPAALPQPSKKPSPQPTLSKEVLENIDLEALAEAMQGAQGIEVGDRWYQSTFYPDCFTGTAAVEWLVQKRDYTREGAILIGQWLLQKGLIQGMADSKEFEDGYQFYQFYRERPASELAKDHKLPSEHATLDEDATQID